MRSDEQTAPDWPGLYAEMVGYLQAAVRDGLPVDAGELLVYLGELRIRHVSLTRDQFLIYVRHEIFNPAARARIRQQVDEWYHTLGDN